MTTRSLCSGPDRRQ